MFIEQFTNSQIIPSLSDFIRIPNLSPQFDKDWQQNNFLEQACNHIVEWIRSQISHLDAKIDILKLQDVPSTIAVTIKGNYQKNQTILCYGHYDKQPYFTGWNTDPTDPVIINGRLYGRGSSDDGCVPYAVIAAIQTIIANKERYNDCILIVEGEEESGSTHLIDYIQMLKLQNIDIMIAIDSGIVDYDRLWVTNSMRGAITFDLSINDVENPFSFLRVLLNKLEDSVTGDIHENFQVEIPQDSYEECLKSASLVPFDFPLLCQKMEMNHTQQYVKRAWKPSISYIGGLEQLNEMSNSLTLRISMRLPPTKDAQQASQQLKELLVTQFSSINIIQARTGLSVKPFTNQQKCLLNEASLKYFGQEMRMFHEGASIPFLNSLYQIYPQSQFLILGVLAPDSNAHGPNENLNINYFNKLIGCLAYIISNQIALVDQ